VLDNGSLVLIVFGGGKNCEKKWKIGEKKLDFFGFFFNWKQIDKKTGKIGKKIGKKLERN
jgi:hypothetical protein